MISKKKLTAIVVAGLFVTPVMAATPGKVWVNEISAAGSMSVTDIEFKEAANNIAKDPKRRDTVFLHLKKESGSTNDAGLMEVTLKSKEGYRLKSVTFAESWAVDTPNRTNKLTLDGTSLDVTGEGLAPVPKEKLPGLYLHNAIKVVKKDNVGSTPVVPNLTTKNDVFLKNGSTLKGDIVNHYLTMNEQWNTDYYAIAFTQATDIHLSEGSQWIGDLKETYSLSTAMGNPVSQNDVKGNYSVVLTDNSTWTGGIAVGQNSKTDVAVDGTSAWIANKDATVNQLRLAEGGRMTATNAAVTIANFAGKGDIVLNKDGKVTVNAASDKVNATFTTLDGSQLTTGDKVDANVLVAGALVDEKGMDAVIAEYNQNNNYTGKGTVTFSGGLINDTVTGKNDAQGNFVVQNVQKNAQLVSIGESTAITMMQWRADADDMYQRMGDLRNNNGAVGVWARTFGGKAEAGHVDNKYYGVQAGVDTQVATTGPKQFVGGAVSYTTGDATFANGTGDNYMGTFTGYSTWLFDNGSYVDVAAKVGKLNNEFDLAVEGKKLAGKYSTQAVALTVESGHRFPVTNLTYVEPQVAFTASHIFGEDYGATNGVTIEQDSINSYVARVGVQAGLNCPDNMGSVFVRASYLYDFDGETSTVAHKANAKDGNRFDQDFGGGWYELGLGMNVNFTKNLYGYADFEYVTGGEIKTPYRWNAGVRYAF